MYKICFNCSTASLLSLLLDLFSTGFVRSFGCVSLSKPKLNGNGKAIGINRFSTEICELSVLLKNSTMHKNRKIEMLFMALIIENCYFDKKKTSYIYSDNVMNIMIRNHDIRR